jgi:hypothetical protein
MHDLPSILLEQQSHAPPKSGEELEVLGKCAAKKYIDGTCKSLNEAVVDTIKHAGLSPEQVRRVIEFTNTDAFLTEHKKEGSSRYVDFHGGPADPGEVLRDLNDGGGGTVFDRGLADYSLPPGTKTARAHTLGGQEKTAAASEFGPTLGDIAGDMHGKVMRSYKLPPYQGYDPFGQGEAKHKVKMLGALGFKGVKVGSAEPIPFLDNDPAEEALKQAFASEEEALPFADPLAPAIATSDKLAGAVDHLTAELTELEGAFHDSLDDVYQHVKQASLEGIPLGHVLTAWQSVVPDADYVKVAFSHISPRLVRDGVFAGFDDVGDSLQKTAHVGHVNSSHPLVGSMALFCMTLDKLAETRAARAELIQARDAMQDFTQKTASVFKRVADSGGVLPKVTRAFRSAGESAGKGTKTLGEVLLGTGSRGAQTAANAVEKGITYTPHAAATLAGLLAVADMRERARYSPAFQTAKNFALARVPYTHQNMVYQNQLAMEGQY